jgi:GntR family transcriptional regulator/MocR family aminotransferase
MVSAVADELGFKVSFFLVLVKIQISCYLWGQINMKKKPLAPIVLDRKKSISLQTQLTLGLKGLMHAGALQPGEPVPSSRELARDLQVSRNTIINAYDRLIGEGYLDASPRRGLFVSESLENMAELRKKGSSGPLSELALRGPHGETHGVNNPRPFRPSQPDVRLFPLTLWNRMRGRVLKKNGMDLLHYHSELALGLPALRQCLATYLQNSRGVRCEWHQIAITTGSQQALFLLSNLLLNPQKRVVMEDPGYLGARLAFARVGAVIQPVSVDENGLRLPPARKGFEPALIYTTPSRQFPTGACLSLCRRLCLVKFAARTKAWIVEDDYDSEFRYTRPPLPSLHSLDVGGRVIYVGSMSKVLFPSLRIGYVVLPAKLIEGFAQLRWVMDEYGPLIDQATLAEFIETGAFYTHIRRCRREYGERLATFLEVANRMELSLTFPHTDGGMNLAGFLAADANDQELSERLNSNGLEVPPLSRYAMKTTRPGIIFGFSAFDRQTIRKSLELFASILHNNAKVGRE